MPINLIGYIFWFTGEWALAWMKGRGSGLRIQAAGKLI